MDSKKWYKMLGKEDAYDRSLYYKVNEHEEPIKLKNLIKKEGLRGAKQTLMMHGEPEELDELHFTGTDLNTVASDLLGFLSTEMKKLKHTNPLDTYYLVQQVLDSSRVHDKIKKLGRK